MDSTFRRGYRAAVAELEQLLQGGQASTGDRLADQIWAVARLLDANPVLRRNLADPSREGQEKAALADRLLSGKVSQEALSVVQAAASQRWTVQGDLLTALERLGVEAVLAHAESYGRLPAVQDELFRFERLVSGTPELQAALSDRRAGRDARLALIDQLLTGKANPETVILAQQAASAVRGQRFERAVVSYLDQAAERQDQVAATVISAVPLSPDYEARLVRALSTQYGRAVHVNIVIDEHVVGGIRVEIGDDVIDGTISHRLADARRRLTH